MGTHTFIRYFVTVTVTSLVTAVTNEFLFGVLIKKRNDVTVTIYALKKKENNDEPFLLIFSRKKL
jgi:hypothetical protein